MIQLLSLGGMPEPKVSEELAELIGPWAPTSRGMTRSARWCGGNFCARRSALGTCSDALGRLGHSPQSPPTSGAAEKKKPPEPSRFRGLRQVAGGRFGTCESADSRRFSDEWVLAGGTWRDRAGASAMSVVVQPCPEQAETPNGYGEP